MISRKEIERLAELSRIEIQEEQKDRLVRDLDGILDHFKELEEVNTDSVKPMSGGTSNNNEFRGDELRRSDFKTEKSTDAFPEREGGFLKIPPVFE